MSYVRTPEHRRLQAELIRKWKPWEQSTGPKTPEGKAKVALNAYKGGTRVMLRELARVLRRRHIHLECAAEQPIARRDRGE